MGMLIFQIRDLFKKENNQRKKCTRKAETVMTHRRKMLSSAIITLDVLHMLSPISAKAGLFGGITEEEYRKETSDLVQLAKEASTLQKDAPKKEEKIYALRMAINGWVARYRREPSFGGRPSYSNMYSAVNALSGHFNSFGPSAPVPKKRLERVLSELEQTSLFLS